MKAAVSIWLWIFDIVLGLYQMKIFMNGQQISQCINIINITANDTHACNILQMFPCRFGRNCKAFSLQFPDNALWGFDTAFNTMNRISLKTHIKFVVQNIKLRFYNIDCRIIQVFNFQKRIEHVLQLYFFLFWYNAFYGI